MGYLVIPYRLHKLHIIEWLGDCMNDELERAWMAAVMVWFKVLCQHLHRTTENKHHMAGEHTLLWSCKAEISVILLLLLQTVFMFLFHGQAALATYEECVPAEL